MDILLVDDETAFAGLLADRLRLRGYTVRCAPNAETALRLIGEKAPDVAFLDVGLPKGYFLSFMRSFSRITSRAESKSPPSAMAAAT